MGEGSTWLGTTLTDLYKGEGPWCFAVPPVIPSKFHHVLYEIPKSGSPTQPHINAQPKHWDDDHVRMPYSPHSMFSRDEDDFRPRWELICEALSKPITNVIELEQAINEYNNNLPKFGALHHLFNEVLEEEESDHFFKSILPGIIKLALSLPQLLPGSIPLLQKNHCKSLSFSQLQVASLLANAFLCTFIWRKETSKTFVGVNFIRLYNATQRPKRENCVAEKLKSLIHYFKRVVTKNPVGTITFERKYTPRSLMPRWDQLANKLGNTRIHINSAGTIEDGLGFLQVDFANKRVGGGVLGYGCVQEEIRFVICPELIISRLFCEELNDNEALVIIGVERFSNYTGYSDAFLWDGNVDDDTPYDEYGRRRTTVVAIDATRFNRPKDQFFASAILRELNKAYVGFSTRERRNIAPVASGNWGCGAFKGDAHLKILIQLMACSAARRDFVYYSFGNEELRDDFYKMYIFLANNRITILQLWRYLCQFCTAGLPADQLYSFIQQSHFDMKSQPTIKEFLAQASTKKNSESLPSTSNSAQASQSNLVKTTQQCRIRKEEDDEIIPQRIKRSRSVTENLKTIPDPENILQFIEAIDGPSTQPKQTEDNLTFLDEIDRLQSTQERKDSVEVPMDIEDDEVSTPVGFLQDKKKKISDYFSKVTSGFL